MVPCVMNIVAIQNEMGERDKRVPESIMNSSPL